MDAILANEMSEKPFSSTPPATPPPLYASHFCTPPAKYFPDASTSSSTSRQSRSDSSGLTSRPTSPELDEKKERSIEVPGIVLTAPPVPTCPLRPASPPPKSVVLLPPTQVTVSLSPPLPSQKYLRSEDPYLYSPSFAALLRSRSSAPLSSSCGIRIVMLLMLAVVGGWHLWSHLESGFAVEEIMDGSRYVGGSI